MTYKPLGNCNKMGVKKSGSLIPLCATLIIRVCICSDEFSSVVAKNVDPSDIQVSPLLLSYVAMCGYDYLCNISNIPIPVYTNRSFKHLALCPQCACDVECFSRGDCCPDVYFKFPQLACRTVDILTIDREVTPPPTYLMSTACPSGSDEELEEECTSINSTLAELLLLPPVTSTSNIPITYLNQFCAECNGEINYSTWDLDINCLKFADFNFLSTYQGIIDLARNRSCNVTFIPTSNNIHMCTEKEPGDIYFKCNMTGTWTNYDPDIDNACSSLYNNQYGIFKNVFCFMCNPDENVNNKVISQCNETGMWLKYDQGLEHACLSLPYTNATKPFRNIFCLLCNVDDLTYTSYIDAKVDIDSSESIMFDEFIYTFRVQSFDLVYLLYELSKGKSGHNDPYQYELNENYFTRPDLVEQNINMTNLLLSASEFNHKGFCYPELVGYSEVNNSLQSCSCTPMCSGECCTDFALIYPASCISESAYNPDPSWSSEYLVVDGCYNKQIIKLFQDLCRLSKQNCSNIFEFLPVQVDTAAYDNVFCYLCNREDIYNESDVRGVLETKYLLQPWDIEVDCKYYLDYKHQVLLYDAIETASKRCTIRIDSSFRDTIYCRKTSGDLVEDKCNSTGLWSQMNPDVQWACEKTKYFRFPTVTSISGQRYKNEFCFMCNSNISSLIVSCNVTGSWNIYEKYLEESCLVGPSSNYFYPYKNVDCWKCNSFVETTTSTEAATAPTHPWTHTSTFPPTYPLKTSTIYPTTILPTITVIPSTVPPDTSFRSLFALGQYNRYRIIARVIKTCSDDQFYDQVQNECRNIKCFPGKLLHDDECKPLLIVTKNLRYVLAFTLNGSDLSDLPVEEVNDITGESVIQTLISHLYIDRDDLDIEELYVLVNKPCSDYLPPNEVSDITISIYLKIFIKSLVPRLQTETTLLDFMSGQLNVSLYTGETSVMDVRQSTDALMMPSYLHDSMNYRNECFKSTLVDAYSVEKQEQYRTVYVLDLLLCEQVQFKSEDFIVNDTQLTLKLLPFKASLQYDKFQIMPDGTARVCLDSVSKYMTRAEAQIEKQKQLSPLVLLTRVCLAISLVSLFVTFLTFCLLPELRTLPGKNNMALMVALFFAHLSFFVIDQANSSTIECTIIGVLSHYFWLCVFGNFNICSFHMYRVFSGGFTNIQRQTDVNRVVIKMALFSFGLPALIVVANITVTVVVTEGQSIGYGENKCFITYKEAFIATLLVPMAFMSLCSLFCFSYTAYVIKSRPNVQKSKADQFEFFVYLKLFVVTGSTWILQVVDTFLPMSFLTYAIAVLNGLQGLFIFLSYICKKRVFELFRKRFCKSENGSSSVTLSTRDDSAKQQSGSVTENTRI